MDAEVASTLATAMGGSLSFKVLAIFSYSGANCLQCPHLRIRVREGKQINCTHGDGNPTFTQKWGLWEIYALKKRHHVTPRRRPQEL
jgi:hypothetical protein